MYFEMYSKCRGRIFEMYSKCGGRANKENYHSNPFPFKMKLPLCKTDWLRKKNTFIFIYFNENNKRIPLRESWKGECILENQFRIIHHLRSHFKN